MATLTKEQKNRMKELTQTVVKNYHAPGLNEKARKAMVQVARTHMMPTAHYINQGVRAKFPTLYQKNVNSKPPNGATRVIRNQNTIKVNNPSQVTIGQNRRNIALAQNSSAEDSGFVTMPYTWSCPMQGMQTAQYTGAISSTYLGNRKPSVNPVLGNSGYVPTGQLLYHSAGAGKTLLMCLTIFYWFVQWWGEVPYYHRIPRNTLNKTSEKGLPCLVIFISEDAQVKDMQGTSGIELFLKIMQDVKNRDAGHHRFSQRFKDVWGDFTHKLPDLKVIHNFSSTPNDTSGIPVIKTDEKHEIVDTWATHMVARLGKENPFYCRTTPAMGMIRSATPGAKTQQQFTLKLNYSPFLNNFPASAASAEYKHYFKNPEKGWPQLDLYLKFLTYAYAVKLRKSNNHSQAYTELQGETKIYKNFSIAKGAYASFIENAAWQQYHHVQKWFTVLGSRTLGGISNPFNLHYRSIKEMNGGHKAMLEALREGDYVRFKVTNQEVLDFKKLSSTNQNGKGNQPFADEAAALGNHWNAWCKRNKDGVSPFFKVLQVTRERHGENGSYFHLKLQRLLIHDALMPEADLSPIFSSDKTTVKADKERSDVRAAASDRHSNLKKGFQVFDILRTAMKPQPSDPPETLCDTSNMRDVEQVLPNEALKVILKNTGAKLRDPNPNQLLDVKASIKAGGEKKGIGPSQLWWMPYGTHESFRGVSDDKKKAYWQSLAGSRPAFMKMVDHGAMPVPEMPDRVLIGMTSQMALHLFDKLPDHALYIVDEAQKYVGTQGKPESMKEINNIVERQNIYCMLSEAVKPKGQNTNENANRAAAARSFTNNSNNSAPKAKAAQEEYTSMCKNAVAQISKGVLTNGKGVPVPAGTKGASLYKFTDFPQLQNRRFQLSGGGGYIQAASATPFLVKFGKKTADNLLDRDVNELERMLRMIGSQRNLKVQEVRLSMLTGKNRSITKKNGGTQRIPAATFTKLGYRNLLQRYLTNAKLMVSFVDLSMDVTKVPLSTPRGKESTVVVSHFVPDRRARLHKEDYGTGEKSEDRIGYPQMNAQNQPQNQPAGKKPKATANPAKKQPAQQPTQAAKTTKTTKTTKATKAAKATKATKATGFNPLAFRFDRPNAGLNPFR